MGGHRGEGGRGRASAGIGEGSPGKGGRGRTSAGRGPRAKGAGDARPRTPRPGGFGVREKTLIDYS
jgi:hypothetical protein